jgi:hypothetical protein
MVLKEEGTVRRNVDLNVEDDACGELMISRENQALSVTS